MTKSLHAGGLLLIVLAATAGCATQRDAFSGAAFRSDVAKILAGDGIKNPWHVDYGGRVVRDGKLSTWVDVYVRPIDVLGKACACQVAIYELGEDRGRISVSYRQIGWSVALAPCKAVKLSVFAPVWGAESDQGIAKIVAAAFDGIPALGGIPASVEYSDRVPEEAFRKISPADLLGAGVVPATGLLSMQFFSKGVATGVLGVEMLRGADNRIRVVLSEANGPDPAF